MNPTDPNDSPHSFPSEVVQVEVQSPKGTCLVLVPRNELFRVETIFEKGEYAVPDDFGAEVRSIVDIGANVGMFALYAKQFINPTATIHCFEPAPNTVSLLERNVEPFPDIHVHSIGLSDRDEEAALHLCRGNTGQNSLKFEPRLHGTSVTVPVRNANKMFDELGLDRIDILKIDTEGSEIEILECLSQRLEQIPCVLLEFHSEADRRSIDALLLDYCLFSSALMTVGRGVVKYVRKSLLEARGVSA